MSEIINSTRNYTALVLALSVAAGSVGLASCANTPELITEGEIIQKIDTPTHDSTVIVPIVTGRICTKYSCTSTYTYVPITSHYPEKFELELKNCNLKEEDTPVCPARTVEVDEPTYTEVTIGQWYKIPQNNNSK